MVQRHIFGCALLGLSANRTSNLLFLLEGQKAACKERYFALPLSEVGFNIPRLENKIQALRGNTLRRLLTEEDAH